MQAQETTSPLRSWGSCLRLWKCIRTFVYAFEPSPSHLRGEGSNEGSSAQYSRSNLQSIYQLARQCFLSERIQHHFSSGSGSAFRVKSTHDKWQEGSFF
jgi:hypothetical protein